jgi:hypothetical protein
MMWEARDEHWHELGKHPSWNESFYFNFFDSHSGWACAVRISVTPCSNERDGFICLYLPDHTTGFVRTRQPLEADDAGITAGSLELRCNEPFREWEIRYDGAIHHFETPAAEDDLYRTLEPTAPTKRLQLRLQAHGLHGPFDYGQRSISMRPVRDMLGSWSSRSPWETARRTFRTLRTLPAMTRARHYEQSMQVRGTVTIEGDSTEVSGLGQRDHSWGVRDMRAPARWRWLSCQFAEDFCFNATQVDVLAMRVQAGFVHLDGATQRLKSWRYEARHGASSFWPDQLSIVLVTESGREVALDAEVMTPLPVIARTEREDAVVTASRAIYRYDDHSAVGMVELMEQLP